MYWQYRLLICVSLFALTAPNVFKAGTNEPTIIDQAPSSEPTHQKASITAQSVYDDLLAQVSDYSYRLIETAANTETHAKAQYHLFVDGTLRDMDDTRLQLLLFLAITDELPEPEFRLLGAEHHITFGAIMGQNIDWEALPETEEMAGKFRADYATPLQRQAHLPEFMTALENELKPLREIAKESFSRLYKARATAVTGFDPMAYSLEDRSFTIKPPLDQLAAAVHQAGGVAKFSYKYLDNVLLELPVDLETADRLIAATKRQPADLDMIFELRPVFRWCGSVGERSPLACNVMEVRPRAFRLISTDEDGSFTHTWILADGGTYANGHR